MIVVKLSNSTFTHKQLLNETLPFNEQINASTFGFGSGESLKLQFMDVDLSTSLRPKDLSMAHGSELKVEDKYAIKKIVCKEGKAPMNFKAKYSCTGINVQANEFEAKFYANTVHITFKEVLETSQLLYECKHEIKSNPDVANLFCFIDENNDVDVYVV